MADFSLFPPNPAFDPPSPARRMPCPLPILAPRKRKMCILSTGRLVFRPFASFESAELAVEGLRRAFRKQQAIAVSRQNRDIDPHE
jgi:hypothetical protein